MKRYNIAISINVRGASKGKKELEQLGGAGRAAAKGLNTLKAGVAGVGAALAALGVSEAISRLSQFTQEAVALGFEMQGIARGIDAVSASAAQADESMAFLRNVSNELGKSFRELAPSFTAIVAASQGTGLSLQEAREAFEAIVSTGALFGQTSEEINRSLTAISQIAAKGTVAMEELRGQLGDAMPIAFGVAARGLDTTQKGLIDLVEEGLDASTFIRAFSGQLREEYAESWEVAGASTQAAVGRITEQVERAKASFGSAFGDELLGSLQDTGIALEDIEGAASALGALLGSRVAQELRNTAAAFALVRTSVEGATILLLRAQAAVADLLILARQISQGAAGLSGFVDAIAPGAGAFLRLGDAVGESVISIEELERISSRAMGQVEERTEEAKESAKRLAQVLKQSADAGQEQNRVFSQGPDSSGVAETAESTKELAKAAREAAREYAEFQGRIAAATGNSEVERLVASLERIDSLISNPNTSVDQLIDLTTARQDIREQIREATRIGATEGFELIEGGSVSDVLAKMTEAGLNEGFDDAKSKIKGTLQEVVDDIDWSFAGNMLANAFLSRMGEFESQSARDSNSTGFTLTRDSALDAQGLGTIVGDLLGNYLGDGIGDFLGPFLGRAFAEASGESRPFTNFVIEDDGRGNIELGNGDDFALNKRDAEEVADFARAIIDTMEGLVEGLGGVVLGLEDSLNFFEQDGLIQIRNGAGEILATAETIEEAFEKAVLLLTSQAGIAGLPGAVSDILRDIARTSGSFDEFEERLRALGPLFSQIGFSEVSSDVRQLVADLVEMSNATAKYGIDLETLRAASDEAFGSLLDGILGPIARFLPGYQEAQLDRQFAQTTREVNELRRALEEQITALQKQRDLALESAEAVRTNADGDQVNRSVEVGEEYTEMLREQTDAYENALAELRRQLDALPTQAELDQARERARGGNGAGAARKREREALLDTIRDLNEQGLPDLQRELLQLARDKEEALEQAKRLGVGVDEVAEAFEGAAARAEQLAFDDARTEFFDFLSLTDDGLTSAFRQIADQAESVTDRFRELYDAGLISEEQLERVTEDILNQADALRTQRINDEAQSLFVSALQFAGKTEEAARAQFELTKAELTLRVEALKREAAIRNGGRIDLGLIADLRNIEQLVRDATFNPNSGAGGGSAFPNGSDPTRGVNLLQELLDELDQVGRSSSGQTPGERLAEINEQVAGFAERMLALGGPMEAVGEAATRLYDAFEDELLAPLLAQRQDILGNSADPFGGFRAAQEEFFEAARLARAGNVDALGELPDLISTLRSAAEFLDPNTGARRAIDLQIVSLIDELAAGGITGDLGEAFFQSGQSRPFDLEAGFASLNRTTEDIGTAQLSELQQMRRELGRLADALDVAIAEREIA